MSLLGNWVSGGRIYTTLEGLPPPQGLQPLQGLPPLEGLPPGRTTNPPRITIPLPEGLPVEGLQPPQKNYPWEDHYPQKDYPSAGRTTLQKNYPSPPPSPGRTTRYGKRAVHILLECFLVSIAFTIYTLSQPATHTSE